MTDQPDSVLGDAPPSRRRGHLDAADLVAYIHAALDAPELEITLRAEQAERERDSYGRETDRLRGDWVRMRTRAEAAENLLARIRDLATTTHTHTATGRSDYDIGRHNLAGQILSLLDGPDPVPEPAVCPRCKGHGKVPDWANFDPYHGEPKPKPCPDCTTTKEN